MTAACFVRAPGDPRQSRAPIVLKRERTQAGRHPCCSSPSQRSRSLTGECDNCEHQGKGDCSSLGSVTRSCPAPQLSRLQTAKSGTDYLQTAFSWRELPPATSSIPPAARPRPGTWQGCSLAERPCSCEGLQWPK